MLAYACEPHRGSEPGVGWNVVTQISQFHQVWVITRANNQEPIEHALCENPLPKVHWIYFDLPRWARFWKRKQFGVHLYYYLWQVGAYIVGRKVHKHVNFDLVHHVTFVNYWLPSFLSFLPVPFIHGPIGGGESAPKAFYKCYTFHGIVHDSLRDFARWAARWDGFLRLSLQRSAVIIATTDETAQRLHRLGISNVRVLTQVALSSQEIQILDRSRTVKSNAFRLMSIGSLVSWKGFQLGLKAFDEFQRDFPSSEYWLVGDGWDRGYLGRLANRLGLQNKVHFLGSLPRNEVLRVLAECDVIVHPSLHDSGSFVCLEAMAAGKPIICLNLGGPGFLVTDEVGYKVPARSPQQAILGLAEAMRRLALDPELRQRMGENGKRRVRANFTWETKRKEFLQIYEDIAGP
jgi:glycosyltransferase involved in cell wall biosynthesis